MKRSISILTMIALSSLVPLSFAEDKPAEEKCKMMQKPAAAAVPNEAAVRQQELEKLLAEMNGNVGPKKIEAMAAILNKLVDQSKIQAGAAAKPAAGTEAPKADAPHH